MDAKEILRKQIVNYLIENGIDRTKPNCYSEVAKDFGVTSEYIRNIYRKLRQRGEVEQGLSFVQSHKDGKEVSYYTADYKEDRRLDGSVQIQDVVDRRLSEDEIFERYGRDRGSYLIKSIWFKDREKGVLLSVNFAPIKQAIESLDYQGQFKEFVESFEPKDYVRPEIQSSKDGITVVLNIADLHVGKLVSEEETGERYNIKIAKERFIECVSNIAEKASKMYTVKKFILSTLGDTLHVDSVKSLTTSGTYVESDTRASKMFSAALEIITEGIEILKSYGADVEFINVNGNHCELSEQHLGIALAAFYRNDEKVKIDAEPKNRKYRLVGKNMLVWTHGDTKTDALPLTIATEQPKMFGNSLWRIIQCGHLHQSKKRIYQSENEHNGVIVRHFSSLSSSDFWHNKNCFTGSAKKATALIFEDGIVGISAEINHTI